MSGYDIFGLFAGITGIVGLLYALVERHLPSTTLLLLEGSLEQTDSLLCSAIEEGLLINAPSLQQQLSDLKKRAEVLAARTHEAATIRQQCMQMLRGLTCNLHAVHSEAKVIRATIASQQLLDAQRRNETSNARDSAFTLVNESSATNNVLRSRLAAPRPSLPVTRVQQASGAEPQPLYQLPRPTQRPSVAPYPSRLSTSSGRSTGADDRRR